MVRCQELGSAVYRTRVALHYERNDVAKVLGELPPLTHADAADGDGAPGPRDRNRPGKKRSHHNGGETLADHIIPANKVPLGG